MENIIENVLKDFREGDGQFTSKLENVHGWSDHNKRYGIYQNFKLNEGKSSPDADHWKRALDSYMSYPCFKGNHNYYWSKTKIFYDNGNHYVGISADLLTNARIVEEWITLHSGECFSEDEKKVISAFNRVSYTAGNFCPIWKNGGSGQGCGNDNIWYKLANGGNPDDDNVHIENRKDVPSNQRGKKDLFKIVPQNNNYVKELFFADFFNEQCELIWNNGTYSSGMEKEMFVEFVRLTTVLIVRRSYRIFKKIKEKNLDGNNNSELKEIYKRLKMEDFCSVLKSS